ncbi:MAG: EAL domain-containing protein [Pseudomonadota bacterium]
MRYVAWIPLRITIPALVVLSALLGGAYFWHHDTRLAARKVEHEARLRLIEEMSDLQRELEHLSARRDDAGAALEIVPLAANPHVHSVFLADENGTVLHATRRDWVGQPAGKIFPDLRADVLARVKERVTGEVLFSPDRSALMGYYPVILGTTGDEPRPSRIGTLFMQYDLARLKNHAVRAAERQVLQSSLFVTGLAALLGLLFHFALTRRVARLVTATERFAAGDFSVQSGLHGNDELARIGRAFDRMARTIEADSVRLRESTLLLEHQALHDRLTNLPNRVLLEDRLKQAMLRGARGDKPLALLVMDLDRFKDVNDTLGHHAGDLLLQQVALRLHSALRKSDTIARLGGDEFAVLLPEADGERAARAASKIVTALERPFLSGGRSFAIGASIGIALFPDHGADHITLLRRADVAMYAAKRARSGYAIYDPEQDQGSLMQLTLTSELARAIKNNELLLHYQPQVDMRSGRVVNAEALVRWQHPQAGLMFPDKFILVAERTGLIKPLTAWVLDEALRQTAAWRGAGTPLSVAINLSASNLSEPQLCAHIAGRLRAWGTPPADLELEITESAIMIEPERALSVLTQMDEMGLRLSIDDFGTGYSSLAYLKKLPIDHIKIDKSFVMNMTADGNDAVIVRSTIDLAHNLGLKVIAEGVESQEVWDMLARYGCDMAQGYFISQPLAPADFAIWFNESSAMPARSAAMPVRSEE